jgi:tRNA A37 threonylcarbamoyltransferase TsaD
MIHSKDIQGLFDPVVREISNLVRQQVKEVRSKTDATIDVIFPFIDSHNDQVLTFTIQRIILVGGFAESPYLYKAIAEWCKINGNIKLMRPEYPYVLFICTKFFCSTS